MSLTSSTATARKPQPTGYILYEGPSTLDGQPIAAILTATSRNAKTADMPQVWILRSDIPPHHATRTGADSSICGDCPLRHYLHGACYVLPHQAPLSIYRAYHRGRYTTATASTVHQALRNRPIRLGAYGDPAAVPTAVWRRLMPSRSYPHTGYTHQWRRPDAQPLRAILLASVESADDEAKAQALGWRTFRVLSPTTQPSPRTIECLSTARGLSCADCRACNGTAPDRTPAASIYIHAHGARAKRLPIAA